MVNWGFYWYPAILIASWTKSLCKKPYKFLACSFNNLYFSTFTNSIFHNYSFLFLYISNLYYYLAYLYFYILICHNLYTYLLCSIYFILLLFWANKSNLSYSANFYKSLFLNSLYKYAYYYFCFCFDKYAYFYP